MPNGAITKTKRGLHPRAYETVPSSPLPLLAITMRGVRTAACPALDSGGASSSRHRSHLV